MHIWTSYRHPPSILCNVIFQKEEDEVVVQSLYSFPARGEKLLILTIQKEKEKQAMPTTFNHS